MYRVIRFFYFDSFFFYLKASRFCTFGKGTRGYAFWIFNNRLWLLLTNENSSMWNRQKQQQKKCLRPGILGWYKYKKTHTQTQTYLHYKRSNRKLVLFFYLLLCDIGFCHRRRRRWTDHVEISFLAELLRVENNMERGRVRVGDRD